MGPTVFLNWETGLDLLQLHPMCPAHVAEDLEPNQIQTFPNGKNPSDFLDGFPKTSKQVSFLIKKPPLIVEIFPGERGGRLASSAG